MSHYNELEEAPSWQLSPMQLGTCSLIEISDSLKEIKPLSILSNLKSSAAPDAEETVSSFSFISVLYQHSD